MLTPGDYVLATQKISGKPYFSWALGFYVGKHDEKYILIDNDGNIIDKEGFAKAQKITKSRGEFIIKNLNNIEENKMSLWWWAVCPLSYFR